MIFVELFFTCDVNLCDSHTYLPGDAIAASDREQFVRVPGELPAGWHLDNQGNIFCSKHARGEAMQ